MRRDVDSYFSISGGDEKDMVMRYNERYIGYDDR